jgi:hypothetical protein
MTRAPADRRRPARWQSQPETGRQGRQSSAANEVDLNRPSLLSGRLFFFGLEKGASRIATYKVYQADIQQPRKASLVVYRDTHCWITLADSEGAETTIAVNLDDEGDRKFADQLRLVAGVLAVMMPEDEGEE